MDGGVCRLLPKFLGFNRLGLVVFTHRLESEPKRPRSGLLVEACPPVGTTQPATTRRQLGFFQVPYPLLGYLGRGRNFIIGSANQWVSPEQRRQPTQFGLRARLVRRPCRDTLKKRVFGHATANQCVSRHG